MAKDNTTNVERMRQDVAPATRDIVISAQVAPVWEALADCPITLTMRKILNLVPQFRQAMESRLQKPHKVIPTLVMEHNHEPTVIDYQNPAIKVQVQGTEIMGCMAAPALMSSARAPETTWALHHGRIALFGYG